MLITKTYPARNTGPLLRYVWNVGKMFVGSQTLSFFFILAVRVSEVAIGCMRNVMRSCVWLHVRSYVWLAACKASKMYAAESV